MKKRVKVVHDLGIIFTPRSHEADIRVGLQRAGFDLDLMTVIGNIVITSIIVGFAVFLAFIFPALRDWSSNALILSLVALPVLFLSIFAVCSIIVIFLYAFFSLKNYNRTKQIEAILPDFLQLAAANMRSGMMIDKALWMAVRPQFGILSREIEIVAKKTITGENVGDALKEFADKYDSEQLRRSIHLLVEGMESGGKVADLLSKISWNLRESQLMRNEMSASVVTYAIFISFTVLVAAPFLFGLSYTLLTIVGEILPNIGSSPSSGASMMIAFTGVGITPAEFSIFVIVMLSITSLMSCMIISMIQKGSIKPGLRNVPIYIGVTVSLYMLSKTVLGLMFSGLF